MGTEDTGSNPRKRSPRAPSFSLKEALSRVLDLYEKEGRHPVAVDVAAQDIGYKDAAGGAAKTAMATLRQYGLIDRPTVGQVVVAQSVETYKYAPEESVRAELLVKWMKLPEVYQQLLDKYGSRLPSDGQLRFDLIQQGFVPQAAEEQVKIFKESVEFARYLEHAAPAPADIVPADTGVDRAERLAPAPAVGMPPPTHRSFTPPPPRTIPPLEAPLNSLERIPIRLSGGRRAYLIIPEPFYETDKAVINDQLNLIMADDPPPLSGSPEGGDPI